jgi:hypothetical protein
VINITPEIPGPATPPKDLVGTGRETTSKGGDKMLVLEISESQAATLKDLLILYFDHMSVHILAGRIENLGVTLEWSDNTMTIQLHGE